MVVIKITKSGNGVMVIDDRGFIFTFSRGSLLKFLTKAPHTSNPTQRFRRGTLMTWTSDMSYPEPSVYFDGEQYTLKEAVDNDILSEEFVSNLKGESTLGVKKSKEEEAVSRVSSDVSVEW